MSPAKPEAHPIAASPAMIDRHGASWHQWITDALAKGCDPKAMLETMTKSVWAHEEAVAALEEGKRLLGMSADRQARRPSLSTDDRIVLPDGQLVTVLSRIAKPCAAVLGDVLTQQECAELIEHARSKGLSGSRVVDRQTGESVAHEARTSTGVWFSRGETPLIARLERRLAALTGWDIERGEGLQVLCYAPGQQYVPHFDWFDRDKPGSAVHLKRGGQRVATTVVYLAPAESGGGTSFPKVGVEVRPPRGGAVFFCDVDELGAPDKMSLHGGTPVVRGEKIVATYWQREDAFDKPAPRTTTPLMPRHRYAPIEGRIERLRIRSQALEKNRLGDPAEREVAVYLPPGYDDGGDYLLFVDLVGFGGGGPAHADWRAFDEDLPHRLERLVKEGRMGPVVLAMPDCFTSLGGNQYINSDAMGPWADFLLDEMLPELESRFRIRKGASGRAVFGKSSGGYGAIAHGLLHGEHWGAVACHSGDMLFERIFLPMFPQLLSALALHGGDAGRYIAQLHEAAVLPPDDFHHLMLLAMCASFDPDPEAPYGVRLPVDPHTCEVIDERWQRWLAWDPVRLAGRADCLARLRGLKGLFVDCGTRDQFHLLWGARALTRRLKAAGVVHHYEEFDDNHSAIDYRLDTSLPYLFKALQSAAVKPPAVATEVQSFDDHLAVDKAVRELFKTDRAGAVEVARRWVEAKPNYTHARVMYAWTLAGLGDPEEEIRQLQQCLAEAPGLPIERSLALACLRVGDCASSLQHRLKALEYKAHEPRDVILAAFGASLLGQRDWALSLHRSQGAALETPAGIFGRFLLENTHSSRKRALREQLLALGERSDEAVWFWKEFDAHPFRIMDNKRGLNGLIRKGCPTRPDWWPETHDFPDLDGSTVRAVQAAGPVVWIYKRSNFVATQGCLVGRGPDLDWLAPSDRVADAVLQRYMEAPFLVQGRKFNIRLQLCLQAPYADAAFLWHDGLVFISPSRYDPNSFETDRTAHLVNPLTAQREQLCTPIGPYPAPGIALRQFLEITFDAPQRERIRETIVRVASEVAAMLEASGLFEEMRANPHWRAFPPKFFGFDMSLDEDLRPWLFELERFTGMGLGSPTSKEVLARFRCDWLRFAMGAESKEFIPLARD